MNPSQRGRSGVSQALPAQKSSFQRRNQKEGDIMTRLSTGLAAACQLKREGPVEMKELFTRAPWERDLKKSVTAGSRGTGGAGCVLASYSSGPASQHPQRLPLKEGSRKLRVFVVSVRSSAWGRWLQPAAGRRRRLPPQLSRRALSTQCSQLGPAGTPRTARYSGDVIRYRAGLLYLLGKLGLKSCGFLAMTCVPYRRE
ncbi:uncharacterized protein LOC115343348 isoform X2 [Aquila chrysaetos chrysaetos]|uniref:uncharacterized protein LOC115343348 isoform X2 n=1 Tax=Aquila chrysaetos chrysaetos TaxID=223781 RepID=UPI001B7D32E5|nr:uncharacterized protein LOC115343348 isoform X2 [Aquila chrysaetos chrysaetos]